MLTKLDRELLLLLVLLAGGGGGGGAAFEPLDRLARSCWTLCAAVCAVVVLPDLTEEMSVFRSLRNCFSPELEPVPSVEPVVDDDALAVDVLAVDVLAVDPNSDCRSFSTALAAVCSAVALPEETELRSELRSLAKPDKASLLVPLLLVEGGGGGGGFELLDRLARSCCTLCAAV